MKQGIILAILTAYTIPAVAQNHKVSFEMKDNQIFVAARVNGRKALLKLDTGAMRCVLFKFEPPERGQSIEVRTATAVVKASRGAARVEMGDLALDVQADYLRTASLNEDGVIGLDVLSHFSQVIFDFKAKEIELVP